MSRLALGTVQFGLDYGVSNPEGRVPAPAAAKIIETATACGIDTYDTSPAYGDSEEVLGRLLPPGSRLVTKVPRLPDGPVGRQALDDCAKAFRASLRSLGVASVYGLLVHWADDLMGEGAEALFGFMRELKAEGKVLKIGVSVYHAGQIDAILANFPIDMIQLPLNVMDQRLLHSGHLSRLKDRGVEIHVRSVFLQGLLLMEKEALPAYFGPYLGKLDEFHGRAARTGLSPLELSLGFVLGIGEVDKVVVGVNNAAQLQEIIRASRMDVDMGGLEELATMETGLLNPSLWKV